MLTLRPATKTDLTFLFHLVNESSVRANSFTSAPITLEEHTSWFFKKLAVSDSYLFVAELDGTSIGQIRVEKENGIGIISFSLSSSYHGHGYGSVMLKEVVHQANCKEIPIQALAGYVKKENLASRKSFLKAGFIEYEETDRYVYWFPDRMKESPK